MSAASRGECCIVGYGAHARSKLAPALDESGWRTVALVSRTAAADEDLTVFSSLEAALSALPQSTTFVVASPPSAHFSQVSAIVEAGCDVLVEKPAFLSSEEVEFVRTRAESKRVVVAEMFMYLEAAVCGTALQVLERSWHDIRRVEMVFTLPSVPEGTFRGGGGLAGSLLADIGCYPLSLLARAGLPLDGLSLRSSSTEGAHAPRYSVDGRVRGVDVGFTVGLAESYRNSLDISLSDGAGWTIEPFFYGRPGARKVVTRRRPEHVAGDDPLIERIVHEDNAFKSMFSRGREEWLSSQVQRFREMSVVTAALCRLGKEAGLADEAASRGTGILVR